MLCLDFYFGRANFLKADVNLSGEMQLPGLSEMSNYYENLFFNVFDCKCSSSVTKS